MTTRMDLHWKLPFSIPPIHSLIFSIPRMIYPLILLLSFHNITVLSQSTVNNNSGEMAYNNTSINGDEDKGIVYYYQPPNEWIKLNITFFISAASVSLIFLFICCLCGMKSACSPVDKKKKKYISHA